MPRVYNSEREVDHVFAWPVGLEAGQGTVLSFEGKSNAHVYLQPQGDKWMIANDASMIIMAIAASRPDVVVGARSEVFGRRLEREVSGPWLVSAQHSNLSQPMTIPSRSPFVVSAHSLFADKYALVQVYLKVLIQVQG